MRDRVKQWLLNYQANREKRSREKQRIRRLNKDASRLRDELSQCRAECNDLREKEQESADKTAVLEQEISRLTGEAEVLRAQLEMYTKWEAAINARLDAEAARQSAKKVHALELTRLDENGRVE